MWPVPVGVVLSVFGLVTGFLPVGIGCGSGFRHPDFRDEMQTESVRVCQQNTNSFGAAGVALLFLAVLLLAVYLLLPGRMVSDPPTGAVATLTAMSGLRDQGVLTDEEFTTQTAQLVLIKRPDRIAG